MKRKERIGRFDVYLNGCSVSLFEGNGPKCNEYKKIFRDEKNAKEYYLLMISTMKEIAK